MYREVELEASIPEICVNVEEIYSTYAYFYSPKFKFEGERHEAWELIFANSGEVIIETPEYTKTLSKGQILIHTPFEPHKIRANNVACNLFFISFKCDCARLYDIAQKPLTCSPVLKNYIMTIVNEGLVYLQGKNDIPDSAKKPEFASSQIIKNFTELLLIELMRRDSRTAEPHEAVLSTAITEQSVINQIISFMEENVCSKLKLEQISLHVGYSVPRLCAIFKSVTGQSVMAYFTKLRIQKAKKLMVETDMSIGQISEYLDYDNVQYFSSTFKKITGMSPARYVEYLKSQNFQHDVADNIVFLK